MELIFEMSRAGRTAGTITRKRCPRGSAGQDHRRLAAARRSGSSGTGRGGHRPPLHPSVTPQFRGRRGLLPPGLLYDEVQPEDQRECGPPGWFHIPAPLCIGRVRPGQPAASSTNCPAPLGDLRHGHFTLQPAAGAHGELTGVMVIKKHFEKKGEKRSTILIPDTAHGTNPRLGCPCGFQAGHGALQCRRRRRSGPPSGIDDRDVAGLMLTNPNTLGLFERNIDEVSAIVHGKGGLLTATAPTPTRSSGSQGRGIWASTSSSSTSTRRSPLPMAAEAPAAGPSASRPTWCPSCLCRGF